MEQLSALLGFPIKNEKRYQKVAYVNGQAFVWASVIASTNSLLT
jgi:hypothetical protein